MLASSLSPPACSPFFATGSPTLGEKSQVERQPKCLFLEFWGHLSPRIVRVGPSVRCECVPLFVRVRLRARACAHMRVRTLFA